MDNEDQDYRSYSQLSTYLRCPRQFQLEKLERVPRKPGWWFPGGTTVHKVIELYLREVVKKEMEQ